MSESDYNYHEGAFYSKPSYKDKLSSALGTIGGFIIAIAFLWGETFGLYHAFTKHDDGFVALFVPPVAWYHGVEGLFWHNDFSGIDWDRQFNGDIKVILTFLGSANSDDIEMTTKRQQAIVEFSTRISKYPKAKKEHLMKATLVYCKYYVSSCSDMLDYFKSLYKDEKLQFDFSDKTKAIRTEIQAFKEMRNITDGDKEEMLQTLDKINLADSTVMPYEDYVEYANEGKIVIKNNVEDFFRELFGKSDWEKFRQSNPYYL